MDILRVSTFKCSSHYLALIQAFCILFKNPDWRGEDGWRFVAEYCTDFRVAMGVQNIVDDLYMRATEFMH